MPFLKSKYIPTAHFLGKTFSDGTGSGNTSFSWPKKVGCDSWEDDPTSNSRCRLLGATVISCSLPVITSRMSLFSKSNKTKEKSCWGTSGRNFLFPEREPPEGNFSLCLCVLSCLGIWPCMAGTGLLQSEHEASRESSRVMPSLSHWINWSWKLPYLWISCEIIHFLLLGARLSWDFCFLPSRHLTKSAPFHTGTEGWRMCLEKHPVTFSFEGLERPHSETDILQGLRRIGSSDFLMIRPQDSHSVT